MGTKISVNAPFVDLRGDEQTPRSTAYVFSAKGELLGQQPVDEKGNAQIEIDTQTDRRLHVIVGPEIEGKTTLSEMRRLGGVEQTVRPSNSHVIELQSPILRDQWSNWLTGLCFVQGRLNKRFSFGPFHFTLPVPNALIEVYEVDPFPQIIWKLPDEVIEQIRDAIRFPIPLPDPPDFVSEIPVGPIPLPDPVSVTAVRPQSPALRSALRGSSSFDAQNGNRQVSEAPPAPNVSTLQYLAERTSTLQFRQALVVNPDLVRPLLCILRPQFVTMQLVATATTDECGYFRTLFYKGVNNPDQPDLYFRAKQQIHPGPMTTIYAPTPVACYTFWNYACGTEVSLSTTHPEAIVKTPCVDLSDGVIVDRIGDYPLSQIHGTSLELQPTTDASNLGLTADAAPWGGQLRLRLEFDPDLPTDDVHYYRVSYRRHGDADPTNVTVLNAPVSWTAVRFPAVGEPIYSPYEIGPKTAPNGTTYMYEIHSRGNSAPGGIGFWSAQNIGGVVANNTNAIFDTTVPAGAVPADQTDKAGRYDLIVELFNANGDPISLAAEHIRFYVPPSQTGDTTADQASALGLMEGDKFVFTLYIDNNPPVADVQEPHIGLTGAGDCGALEYANVAEQVTIPFIGGQRNGFATYAFSIRRGGSDIFNQPALPAGVGSNTLVRTIDQSVEDLLSTCPVAGLRAAVTVHPTAITGWGPVYGDIGDDYAFALAPITP